MRTVTWLFLSLAAGCSSPPVSTTSRAPPIPAEAVSAYAKAHGLSRDQARLELEMYRDAEFLKELKAQKSKPAASSPTSNAKPVAGPSS